MYISTQYIHHSHLYNSQGPWYFQKRPSLGKGRQAAHSSDKTFQFCQGSSWWWFEVAPCLPQSRKVEEEAQWEPMGVLWLHPSCQQVNKRHTVYIFANVSLHCHWKHFNKRMFAVNVCETVASECTSNCNYHYGRWCHPSWVFIGSFLSFLWLSS